MGDGRASGRDLFCPLSGAVSRYITTDITGDSAGVNVNDDIAVIRTGGEGYRNLTRSRDANEWGPVWSPDGSQIATAR